MKSHELQLSTVSFEAIASGRKIIESRLYDEKRQGIEIGDQIVFVNREAPEHTLLVNVKGLLRYRTFNELFTSQGAEKFGYSNIDDLMRQIFQFYVLEDEKTFGVLGIEIELARI